MACDKCGKRQKVNLNYERTKKAAIKFGEDCEQGCKGAWVYSKDKVHYDFCFEYSQIDDKAIFTEYILFVL